MQPIHIANLSRYVKVNYPNYPQLEKPSNTDSTEALDATLEAWSSELVGGQFIE